MRSSSPRSFARGLVISWAARLALCAGLFAAACVPDLELTGDPEIACTDDAECPSGWECRRSLGRCVSADSNLPPSLRVQRIAPAAGRELDRVELALVAEDPNAPPEGEDRVSVTVEVTSEDPATGGTWYPAAAHPSSDPHDPLTEVGPESAQTFVWDALADARSGVAGLSVMAIDTDGDGSSETEVVAYTPRVYLRATPRDAAGATGAAEVIGPLALGNGPPLLHIGEVSSPLGGDVPIPLLVEDEAADAARIEVEFQLAADGPWRRAAAAFGATEDLPTLPAQGGGREHVFVWRSLAPADDDPEAPQGIGVANQARARLRARAVDRPAAVEHHGAWDVSSPFDVLNQTAPQILDVVVHGTDLTARHGPLTITYRLVDNEADAVDVAFEFSFDVGRTWSRCGEYALPMSEGTYDLATARANLVDGGGLRHTFVWDTAGIRIAPAATARLRVTARNGPLAPPGRYETTLSEPIGPPSLPPQLEPFADPVVYPTGATNPIWMLAARLDADDVLDLALVAQGSSEVAVLLGNGDGTFADAVLYRVAEQPIHLLAADLDGDGAKDLAATCLAGHGVSVLLGNVPPDGTFRDGGFVATAGEVNGAAAGDFDGDGDLDLALSSPTATGVLLARGGGPFGPGQAPFTIAPADQFDTGLQPMPPVAAELNGDEALDLLVAGQDSDNVTVLLGSAAGGPPLVLAGAYPVGQKPRNVEAVDLDGDAVLDLVVANTQSLDATILIGDGAGGFFPGGRARDLSFPTGMAVADVNGDRILDLATVSPTDDSVGLLLGNGSGGRGDASFDSIVRYASGGSWAACVVAGDFDGDGRADLAVGHHESGDVTVRLARPDAGLGAGALTDVVEMEGGNFPFGLAVADLDRDGGDDVVTVSRKLDVPPTNASVAVLVGQRPDGAAGEPLVMTSELRSGGDNLRVVVTDLDGDGADDVAHTDFEGGLVVLRGRSEHGVGTAALFAPRYFDARFAVQGSAATDFTGDGRPDVVVTDAVASEVLFYVNRGDLELELVGTLPAGITAWQIEAADVDGDGRDDLVVGDFDGDAVLWLQGLAAAEAPAVAFAAARPIPTSGSWPLAFALADLDGDGHLDLVAANSNSDTLAILLGTGDPQAPFGAPDLLVAPGRPLMVVAADLDGDDDLDLVTANYGASTVGVHRRTAEGGYEDAVAYSLGAGAGPSMVAVADVTGDAIVDVVATRSDRDGITLLVGRAGGTFASIEAIATAGRPAFIAVTDAGADGDPDLLISHYASNDLVLLRATPGGPERFAPPIRYELDPREPWAMAAPSWMTFADLDGEGSADLIMPCGESYEVLVIDGRPLADGNLALPLPYAAGDAPADVVAADLDDDGLLDLVVSDVMGNRIAVLRRRPGTPRADEIFLPAVFTSVPDLPDGLAVADFDADGVLDVAVAAHSGVVAVLRGAGDGTFTEGALDVYPTGGEANALAVGDLSSDGIADLVVANLDVGDVHVLLGDGAGGRGDGTFTDAGSFPAGPLALAVQVADVDGDAILDVIVGLQDGAVALLAGVGAGGVGTGQLAAAVTLPAGLTVSAAYVTDLDADGMGDVLALDIDRPALVAMMGRAAGFRDRLDAFVGPDDVDLPAGLTAVADRLLPPDPDRLGAARRSALSRHVWRESGGAGVLVQLRKEATFAVPTGLVPLSAPLMTAGDVRLTRVGDPWPQLASGPRLRVEQRLGARVVAGDPDDFDRTGAELSGTSLDEQRGFVLELPLLPARIPADLAAATITVYERVDDWLRADALSVDPAHAAADAARYLPRVADPSAPSGYRDVVQRRARWRELGRVSDLATGSGARFVIDADDPSRPRLLVLTDRLGLVQAFTVAP